MIHLPFPNQVRKFFPWAIVDSPFAIDYKALYEMGYRAILFDIDNTLVPHGQDSVPEVDALIRSVQDAGFKTLMISDNNKERIERFLENIDSPYIEEAGKPGPESYFKALELLCENRSRTLVIGDQVFMDILAANRAGLPCVLVPFIRRPDENHIGKRRRAEQVLLSLYRLDAGNGRSLQLPLLPAYTDPFRPAIVKTETVSAPGTDFIGNLRRFLNREILFCDISPLCYTISTEKEILKRHILNLRSKERFARTRRKEKLPNLISSHSSNLLKKGPGIDPVLQENKAVNIRLACKTMNRLVIHPGETFSFWGLVGKTTSRKGYKAGRVIIKGKLQPGLGGGLCNLANTIHRLVLHSPLDVTELHYHSDALAMDEGKRIPFSAGTSVSYNNLDFRFRNNTDQDIQLLLWCKDGKLNAELRSEREFPWTYELAEEDHHFSKEGDKYYRVSKIYKQTLDRATGEVLEKKLVWDNHSEVMFDPSLIPAELLRIKE